MGAMVDMVVYMMDVDVVVYHDVVYADDISSWTIDEMIRLRDSWEYAY